MYVSGSLLSVNEVVVGRKFKSFSYVPNVVWLLIMIRNVGGWWASSAGRWVGVVDATEDRKSVV